MNWFYAENGQQKGPVSDSDLASLAENGSVKVETLLWREGMPDWQPLGRVRPDLVVTTGTPMISGVAVAEQSKDLLVQQMREGVIGELTAPSAIRYVGFWWRFLAWFIDYIIQFVAQQIIQVAMSAFIAVGAVGVGDSGAAGIFTFVIVFLTLGLSLGLNAWYHTWMVVRFGGTLGKMALGFKVVTMDGRPLRWPRALGRWASGILDWIIWYIVLVIPIILVAVIGVSTVGDFQKTEDGGAAAFWILGMVFAGVIGTIAGGFPWWMAGPDKEKRALHDRICATRVVWK